MQLIYIILNDISIYNISTYKLIYDQLKKQPPKIRYIDVERTIEVPKEVEVVKEVIKEVEVPRYIEKKLNYKTMFQKCLNAFQKLVD